MDKAADSFNRPSLTDVAYREIRKGILHGVLSPGRKLVVNELVDEWKISNTPIKEALNRLVAEELVVATPRRGMRVRKYDAGETREIFELRCLLEIHCCRLLAGGIGKLPDVAASLRNILDESRAVAEKNADAGKLMLLDARFHEFIVEQSGNRMLIADFRRLHAHSITLGSAINKAGSAGRWAEAQKEHERILKAVLRGNREQAEKGMREHLDKTCAALLSLAPPAGKSGGRKGPKP